MDVTTTGPCKAAKPPPAATRIAFAVPAKGVRNLVCLSRRCEDNVARWNPAELVMHVDTIAFILHANPSQLANKLYKLIQLVLPCRCIGGYVRLAQGVHIHSPWVVFDEVLDSSSDLHFGQEFWAF
jgi:hypothetical protein